MKSIMISCDLKWADQVKLLVSKANMSIGDIKPVFSKLDTSSFKYVYEALTRPHLKYAVRIWSSYLRKNIIKLENIQKRETKESKSMSYQPDGVTPIS